MRETKRDRETSVCEREKTERERDDINKKMHSNAKMSTF